MTSVADPDVAGMQQADSLPEGLNYELSAVAPYVESKSQVELAATSGTIFTPTGNRVITFQIPPSTQWLVPESLVMSFTVTNFAANGGDTWTPAHYHPMCMFSRITVRCGAALVEDITDAGRLSSMLCLLHSHERRLADAAQGFGLVNDNNALYTGVQALGGAGGYRRVFCQPHVLGLLKVKQLLPLYAMMPFQIQLHLASAEDASGGPVRPYQISEPKLHMDLLQLSDALTSKFLQHSRDGKPLKIRMSSWSCQSQAVANGENFDLISARSFNAIEEVFVNYWRSPAQNATAWGRHAFFLGPLAAANPSTTAVDYDGAFDQTEIQFVIGPWRWPSVPAKGITELIYRLRLAIGATTGPFAPLLASKAWDKHSFLVALDCERYAREGHELTGLRTTGGSLLQVQHKNFGVGIDSRPTDAWLMIKFTQEVTLLGDAVDVAL
jgi:hypothetical protein